MSDRVEYMQNAPDMQYRDRVDIKIIFNNQVQRCLQAIGTEYFPETVEALARILPTASYEKVMNRKGEWVTEVEDFEYTYDGPIWFGTPDKPLMKLKPNGLDEYPTPYLKDEEGNKIIDWSNPNIVSPRLVTKEKEDHMLFMRFILEEAENVNITWRSDPKNVEYGLYPEIEEDSPAEPVDKKDLKKNLDPVDYTSHHRCWMLYKGKPVKVMNFRGYAVGIGSGESPWFFNEIAVRQTKQEPIVFLITAQQGKGKSYFGERLAEIFDKKFDPDLQIAMDRSEIIQLVSGRSPLMRDQVIMIDESQFGANAREWSNKDQQTLMKQLAAARFHGFIIIIVALHRSMLDTIIRQRIVNYHIVIEARGTGTVYEIPYQRFDELKYPPRRGQVILQLPDYDRCEKRSCLTCKERYTCLSTRARYERKKLKFVMDEADKDEKKAQRRASRGTGDNEIIEALMPHISKFRIKTSGNYDEASIQEWAEKTINVSVGRIRALNLGKRIREKQQNSVHPLST